MPIRKAVGFAAAAAQRSHRPICSRLLSRAQIGRDLLAVESPRISPEITIPLLPTSVVDNGIAERWQKEQEARQV